MIASLIFPRSKLPSAAVLSLLASLALALPAGGQPVRQVLPGAPEAPQELVREAPQELVRETPAVSPEVTGTTPAPAQESEIERFCSNIADAARDRRYALQAAELQQLQTAVDKRIAALEAKRAEYEEWLKRREVFLARAEDSVVKIYAGMKPDAAAERLAGVNVELAAAILMKLNARKASTILNEMDKKAAAALTGIMASAARRVDPS
ncbi:MotE family protein [Mesorhizobium sp. SP-1A]|uniref:MotE family protein n=1 Tax=Mesorhizobium sp. SP-1A TaxID=3077840 RepID=UPI0028F6E447|nr:MotE family protein [Mesorhizobium sp. SP-1A]